MSPTTKTKKSKPVEVPADASEPKASTIGRSSPGRTDKLRSPETKTENQPDESTKLTSAGESKTPRPVRQRSKRYLEARKKIDRDKFYPLKDALKLIKETSLSKFDGHLEAHLLVTETGHLGEAAFPHLKTVAKKVVLASDAVIADLKNNKIDFDLLISTPAFMPKLLPFARILGPKGLMPNPKNGTLTDKAEEAVKKFTHQDSTAIKTEKKAPLVHLVVGRISQPESELEANINELIKVIKSTRIKKLSLCATMGPAVKVKIEA